MCLPDGGAFHTLFEDRKMNIPQSDLAQIPPRLAEFRDRYRANVIGPYYNGFAHLAFVVFGSLTVIIFCLSFIDHPTLAEWGCIPATFLSANIVEYLGHRGPMHHRFQWMGLMFHRHTHEHHQFFTEENMTCRSQRDFKIVLFPAVMLLFYLGLVSFPPGILLYIFWSTNVACLYVATATAYFMSYEVLHFCYHLDESSWIARLPIIVSLRAHHRIHHKLELMTKYNFNINWPLADLLFGTVYRSKNDELEAANPATTGSEAESPAMAGIGESTQPLPSDARP